MGKGEGKGEEEKGRRGRAVCEQQGLKDDKNNIYSTITVILVFLIKSTLILVFLIKSTPNSCISNQISPNSCISNQIYSNSSISNQIFPNLVFLIEFYF